MKDDMKQRSAWAMLFRDIPGLLLVTIGLKIMTVGALIEFSEKTAETINRTAAGSWRG